MIIPKGILGLLVLLLANFHARAQKPPIDLTTLETWPQQVGSAAISNNGMYASVHYPDDSLIIKSTDQKWQKSYSNVKTVIFTQDSRQALLQRNDTLFMLHLGNDSVDYICGIEGSFSLLPRGKYDNVLAYRLKKEPGAFLFSWMSCGNTRKYPVVENYWFNPASDVLLLLKKDTNNSQITYRLEKITPGSGNAESIWQGPKVEDLKFNSEGTQFSFLTRSGKESPSLWYYYVDEQKAVQLLNNFSHPVDTSLEVLNIVGISKSNKRVYLTLKAHRRPNYITPTGVDIYSYKDPKLQSQQLLELRNPIDNQTLTAVVTISNGHFLIIESEGDAVNSLSRTTLPDSWVLLVHHDEGDYINESYWNSKAQSSVYLLSLDNGSRKLLFKDLHFRAFNYFFLSPDEKYILFFDPNRLSYYSMEISTRIVCNITSKVKTNWVQTDTDIFPAVHSVPFGIGGFSNDGRFVFIYDKFDIYKVDISGKRAPVNLTSYCRRSRQIRFRIAYFFGKSTYDLTETMLLNAVNETNKDQGYCSLIPNNLNRLGSVSMSPANFSARIIMARDTNVYITIQEKTNSHLNYFLSSDFRNFIPLSDIHPEASYNWMTSELISWHLPDGRKCQGILYKPENLDPQKKYPLIFIYYHKKSDGLHQFLYPQYSGGEINIPLFVSNGYLIFLPDIHYTLGFPGNSALNAIISAADLLAKRPYVNSKKMGLDGMSFGGFETNYVVTHTTRFAAAMSNSGMTDLISAYGSIIGDGTHRARQYEVDHDRIGATPWQRPDLYMENSPVLRSSYVQTPLLMVANNNDPNVPHEQGVEFFTALRRLGKKVWMLQYDGEHHGVDGTVAAKDLTLRSFQFFNYYLKGTLPPKWMTTGIPAKLKGIDNGFQLDSSGAIP